MSKMIFNTNHPMSFVDSGIEQERVTITTDSNGAGSATVTFNERIDYSSGREWGFWVTPSEFCDYKYSNVGADTVDISIQNAPASTDVTLTVVRIAERYVSLD